MVLVIGWRQYRNRSVAKLFAQAKSIGIKVGDGIKLTRKEIIRIQAEKLQNNKGTCDFKIGEKVDDGKDRTNPNDRL